MILSLTIEDAAASRILDGIAAYYNYGENGTTGETKAQFAKRVLAQHVRDVVREAEAAAIRDAAALKQQRDIAAIDSSFKIT